VYKFYAYTIRVLLYTLLKRSLMDRQVNLSSLKKAHYFLIF